MSEKMMICPKHATCERTCKEIGRHCGPHTKTTGCEHGANFCPPCVPVKVKDESPLKNGFKFCPFCGRKIEEVGR